MKAPVMQLVAFACLAAPGLAATAAFANVPVMDSSRASKQSSSAASTSADVGTQKAFEHAGEGIHCSVTTGQSTNVSNPAALAVTGSGHAMLNTLAPGSTNASLMGGGQPVMTALVNGAAAVFSGMNASSQSQQALASSLSKLSGQIGTTSTLQAAMDVNSSARAINGQANAGLTAALSTLLQAVNTRNTNNVAQLSATAAVTAAPGADTRDLVVSHGGACPAGTLGQGTAASPCVASDCSPQNGALVPGCAQAQLMDSYGNVYVFLVNSQDNFSGYTRN